MGRIFGNIIVSIGTVRKLDNKAMSEAALEEVNA
jgi:hypothetical protein